MAMLRRVSDVIRAVLVGVNLAGMLEDQSAIIADVESGKRRKAGRAGLIGRLIEC